MPELLQRRVSVLGVFDRGDQRFSDLPVSGAKPTARCSGLHPSAAGLALIGLNPSTLRWD